MRRGRQGMDGNLSDVTNAMPEWLASLEQRDAYFAEPEYLSDAQETRRSGRRGDPRGLFGSGHRFADRRLCSWRWNLVRFRAHFSRP